MEQRSTPASRPPVTSLPSDSHPFLACDTQPSQLPSQHLLPTHSYPSPSQPCYTQPLNPPVENTNPTLNQDVRADPQLEQSDDEFEDNVCGDALPTYGSKTDLASSWNVLMRVLHPE
jgi:hypothetical protein